MRTSAALAAVLGGGWLAIAGASAALAQAALQSGNPIEGAIDFHVHSAPDARSPAALVWEARRRQSKISF